MDAPNILLLTLDCLRADHMSCYGYNRTTTPCIDELCERSTQYSNHMANGPTTPNSFPSIMCSRYRLEMPGNALPKKWLTIAQILKESGYKTIGMSSMNPWTSAFFGYQRGFDIFNDYMICDNPNPINVMEKWGRVTWLVKNLYDLLGDTMERSRKQDLRFALDVIKMTRSSKMKNPWFLWAHFMDTHAEYFPERLYYGNKRLRVNWYRKILNKIVTMDKHPNINIRQDIIDLYDSAVRQVDTTIGEVLKNIDFDNTMVILTSDHGEAFEEHEHWTHAYNSIYEELLKVPLLIHYPQQETHTVVPRPSSSVDILPTITDVTGSIAPPITRGISLLDGIPMDRAIYHEGHRVASLKKASSVRERARGITFGNNRLVIEYEPTQMRLFNLNADPRENINLVNDTQYRRKKHRLFEMIGKMIENEKKTTFLENGIPI